MTQNTLIVTAESISAVRRRTADAFEQALAGEGSNDNIPRRLSFETTDQPVQAFAARAIHPLQAIAQEEPASIREAARPVDRDIRQVSENLKRLEECGVVEFADEGRAKRPTVPYDEFDVRLPLRDAVESNTVPV